MIDVDDAVWCERKNTVKTVMGAGLKNEDGCDMLRTWQNSIKMKHIKMYRKPENQ